MKEIILIKNGELVLKGLNRRTFEDIMVKNVLTLQFGKKNYQKLKCYMKKSLNQLQKSMNH